MDEGSVAGVQEEVPVASFRGWHPAVTEMIKAASSPIRWGLFTVRPLLRWYRGRVVILGDAAHGMLPHHGQGANTTIEDAFALAALLAEAKPDDLEPAFARFQKMRRARTRKIQRSSSVTSSLLHLPDGPAVRSPRREGDQGPGGLRLDPRVRRAAGAACRWRRPGRCRSAGIVPEPGSRQEGCGPCHRTRGTRRR